MGVLFSQVFVCINVLSCGLIVHSALSWYGCFRPETTWWRLLLAAEDEGKSTPLVDFGEIRIM